MSTTITTTTATKNKYYVRRTTSESWTNIATQFSGVRVLKLDGFNSKGEAVNVYTAQWTDSQVEDFMVTTQDGSNNDVIIRQNVDLAMTFIVSRRYASSAIDEQTVYDSFVNYVCDKGAFYIKSEYANKQVKVVCLKSFEPTDQKLNRGKNSYILATITLHTLEAPVTISTS